MKNVYFVQPNSMLGNSVYYPYAAGVILAYAFQFDEIARFYELGGIIFKEDPVEDVLRSIQSPNIIAFSNYFWNYQYNLRIASVMKRTYPDCTIIFGGHQVPKDTSWLKENPYIDILIFGEGEIPFYQILKHFITGAGLDDIPNLAFRGQNDTILQTQRKFVGVSDYPSPYTTGVFDHLLNIPQGLEFNALLETNRGCPYHCSFCDWCSYDVPIRLFSMEKVKSDLTWIAENQIKYCMCVDSNFGLEPRDEAIAVFAAELKKRTGFPERFGACYAKNKTDRIFRINKVLNDVGMSKGVSLAFQSMSESVLKNVSRSNMNKENLAKQLAKYHEAGIPTYTELILGLPGETYESFCRGICELLELGQHDSIHVFRCEVYPNSDLADKRYVEKFGIRTARSIMNLNHCRIADAVFSGGLDYVVETGTMSAEALTRANLFSCCIQSLHCHGLMQCFAIFLRFQHHISYFDFYTAFFARFYESDGLVGKTLAKIRTSMDTMARGEVDFSYANPLFGDISWPYEEAALLDYIYNLETFYDELVPFLRPFFGNEDVLRELLLFQKSMVVVPGENDTTLRFHYNFAEYFDAILKNDQIPFLSGARCYRFSSQSVPSEWAEYAREIIWYGRRNKRTKRKTEMVLE